MAEAPMTDAQKRAAARKAKILARGNTGLQRLAQTARGDEADKLYGEDSAPTSRPETPVTATSTTSASAASATSTSTATTARSAPGWAPPAASRTPQPGPGPSPFGGAPFGGAPFGAPGGAPAPEEMQAQIDAMMRMFGGGAPGEGAPDMSNLFASLMGGMPPGGAGPGGPGLLGDGATPDFSDPANNPFANMPGMGGMGGMGGMPGMEGMAGMPFPAFPGMAPATPPSKAARYFPLIHAIAVIALVVFVAAWWEPTLFLVRWGGKLGLHRWAARWSSLAGRAGPYTVKAVEPMPIFYAFTTLEALLFATRVTLVQTPPNLHPLLANVLPMLPPNFSRLITTGSKYLGVASQVYADGCLFIFGLGCAIVFAEYIAQ